MDYILNVLRFPFAWFTEYISARIRFFIALFVIFKLWSVVTNSDRSKACTKNLEQHQDIEEKKKR